MCGILAALGLTGDAEVNRRKLLKCSKLIRHRGPDSTRCYQSQDGTACICFERLQIMDVTDAGRQPFVMKTKAGTIAWALNSELYNYDEIRRKYLKGVDIVNNSGSDSAVVGHLYELLGDGDEMWNALDGIFACVIYDERTGEFTAARDPLGICSFYQGRAADGSYWFASEMKALQEHCVSIEIFPPGHVYRSKTGKCERYFNPAWVNLSSPTPTQPFDAKALRESLISAVKKRLMSDVPLGILLSGGLDSSLVASIACRHLKECGRVFDKEHRLHTFSIGLAGAPDLINARKVADFLGTIHHEFHFTVEEGIDALYDLIYHLESIEQVRAAVPMFLLSRKIKAMGIKVVLSGEGADEAMGGYLYFHKAPNPTEYHKETQRLLLRLHQWDVLRANKAPFAWGLETRVPFLDKHFIHTAMSMDPAAKMIDLGSKPDGAHPKLEKWPLRKAFDTPDQPYLPEEVLWRQKEQFSDGVGYSWVDGLQAYADKVVSDKAWNARATRFPKNTPRTKEYYLLRTIFEEHFPHKDALSTVPFGLSIACSTPEALAWDESWAGSHEISGRAISTVHKGFNPADVPGVDFVPDGAMKFEGTLLDGGVIDHEKQGTAAKPAMNGLKAGGAKHGKAGGLANGFPAANGFPVANGVPAGNGLANGKMNGF